MFVPRRLAIFSQGRLLVSLGPDSSTTVEQEGSVPTGSQRSLRNDRSVHQNLLSALPFNLEIHTYDMHSKI